MGRGKNPQSCPYGDNACWLSGMTPRFLYATVTGVTVPSWVYGGSPNGDYKCQQVSSTRWVSSGGSRMAIRLTDSFLEIGVDNIFNQAVFYGYEYGYCLRSLAGLKSAYNILPGQAAFGFAGPDGSSGNHVAIATAAGVLEPASAQFEYNSAFDYNPRVRIAQKLDHTCVKLKLVNAL